MSEIKKFELMAPAGGFDAMQAALDNGADSIYFGVTEKTARLFMHKVREGMKSSGNFPIDGIVHVDEFVVGGKEEGKIGRSYDIPKSNRFSGN